MVKPCMLRVYAYKNCDTCRKALKFLRERGISYQEIPIRETPPTRHELEAALKSVGGEMRRLFNTSGGDYKALNLKIKLPGLGEAEALRLLASHGNLVKRPLVVGPEVTLVGFDPALWSHKL
jgi:arsenate reductase